MYGKPFLQLLDEYIGIIEQAVDQIDHLTVETFQPVGETLARYLWWITPGIVNCQFTH